MANSFPLLHKPIYTPGPSEHGYTVVADLARGLGITLNALGSYRHHQFGPRHTWQNTRFVILDRDLDEWMNRDWRPGEQEMLAELQHKRPSEELKPKAEASMRSLSSAK